MFFSWGGGGPSLPSRGEYNSYQDEVSFVAYFVFCILECLAEVPSGLFELIFSPILLRAILAQANPMVLLMTISFFPPTNPEMGPTPLGQVMYKTHGSAGIAG